ncbi:chemotaxis response regulator protein-glutamate methylesterase [Vibrio gallaecicus]|uniref:protein-glutamate methylesterase/protein-glutamine glutaminase n=1 Tax=Vibrio gallaecicus TaxID=552386 RepID=UPI0010C9FD12|nr:chemotaxis response regulator protein-glutamate methylesterase [Vibrio gallaecicus]MDN3613669.1 chemotaxis response regulator protein-glutamate methylesterase [Vibrio gallaecicus]
MTINVFIVDDSAVIRQVLGEVVDADPDLKLIGVAPDPVLAIRKMNKHMPDVILLDIEMPKMDGITFLKKVMTEHPIPVVILSALTESNPDLCLEALSSGAVEVVNKPSSNLSHYLQSSEIKGLLSGIKRAAKMKVRPVRYLGEASFRKRYSADVIIEQERHHQSVKTDEVIVVGASTGGTDAIEKLLMGMPPGSPPIVIVQHMPGKFTNAFAQRLNTVLQHRVVEAENRQKLVAGSVYIAPGDVHTMISRVEQTYFIELKDGPLVSRHKPSVDVLFRSAAQHVGENCIGVIMTGMGDDGAQGMVELKRVGAYTLAQSEDSCLVFGMPKEAIAKGGVDKVCSLQNLPYHIQKTMVGNA